MSMRKHRSTEVNITPDLSYGKEAIVAQVTAGRERGTACERGIADRERCSRGEE